MQFSTKGMNVFFSPFSALDIKVKIKKIVDSFEYGPLNIVDHYRFFSFSESSTFIGTISPLNPIL